MSLSEAAASGSRIDALRSLRSVLAESIDTCESARDLAALSRQLTDVLTQIEQAEKAAPAKKGTALDELENRRLARESAAPRRARA